MTIQEKLQFAEALEAKIARAEAKVRGFDSLTDTLEPDCAIGSDGRLAAQEQQQLMWRGLQTATAERDALLAVRSRIDSADFGHCAACGKAIAFGRLLALPLTIRCMDCERK